MTIQWGFRAPGDELIYDYCLGARLGLLFGCWLQFGLLLGLVLDYGNETGNSTLLSARSSKHVLFVLHAISVILQPPSHVNCGRSIVSASKVLW